MASVKSAISIEERLFKQVDDLARELNISRSRLIGVAVREYIERHNNRAMIQALNETYDDAMEVETSTIAGMRPYHRSVVKDRW